MIVKLNQSDHQVLGHHFTKALLHQLLSLSRRTALGRVRVVLNFFHKGNGDHMLLLILQ